MAEQNTKPEVTAAQASKRQRRMAKSDIFSGITKTTAATHDKDSPTVEDLVGGMLIKNKDKEEYVADSPDKKAAMVDREGDTPTETEATEVPRVAKMLKRVFSKNKETEKPPDGEGDNSEEVKTQAQPKLSRLLKRVLKDSKGSTERDVTTEDAPAEAKNEGETRKEEESLELTPSTKGFLVRALRKRAESRKKKAEAANESSNKEKEDEGKKEVEGDSQTKFEAQVQPKFARVLKRMLTDKRESEDRQDEDKGKGGKEEKNDETKSEEQKGTAEVGTFELTPSTKRVLVRALRKRAEFQKKKAAAADEGLNKEIADEPNSENQGQSEKQVQPKFARVLKRMLTDKRESEDRQEEDRTEGGKEEKNDETKSEEQKGTAEEGTFELTPSTKSLLVRALRKRAESRKNKAAAADDSSNKEKVDEANNEKSQQEGEGQDQGQSEKQVQPKFARVLKRMLIDKRESEDRQNEDRGEGEKEDSNGELKSGKEGPGKEDDVLVISSSVRGLLVRTLRAKAEAKRKREAEQDKGTSGDDTGSTHNNQEHQGDTDERQTEPEGQAQGQKEGKADDEVNIEDEDSSNPGQNKTKVNRMVKRAFSKNKKRQEFQSTSSQDEGFSSIVQRSIDLQDTEKRTKEQQDKTTEQGSILEDNTVPQTVLNKEKDSETKDDITQPGTGHEEEGIKAKEANGAKGEEGGERAEMAEEKTANGGDSPHGSTSDSQEPGRCSGACVII